MILIIFTIETIFRIIIFKYFKYFSFKTKSNFVYKIYIGIGNVMLFCKIYRYFFNYFNNFKYNFNIIKKILQCIIFLKFIL